MTTKLDKAERDLQEVLDRIAADPKTKQAEAMQQRADDLTKRADKLREEGWKLSQQVRDIVREVQGDHDLARYQERLAEATAEAKAREEETEQARLIEEREAWLKAKRVVLTDADFAAFCELGLPGVMARSRYEAASTTPISHEVRRDEDSKEFPPTPATALPAKSKHGRFTIRTADVRQEYSTRRHWVAFDEKGRCVALMVAEKYGHAFDPMGQDLKRADKPSEDALVWPRSRHSAGPKVRFEQALDAAFPQPQVQA